MSAIDKFWVYILRCSDGSYYTGVTNNLKLRIGQHQEGMNPESYTYTKRPLQLIYSCAFDSSLDAIAAEKQIKGWSRKKKEAIIDGQFDLLTQLAKKRNFRR